MKRRIGLGLTTCVMTAVLFLMTGAAVLQLTARKRRLVPA